VLQQSRARIHTGVDLHRGESLIVLAVGNGPMNWGGPAIAWQQRRMQIDPADAGKSQKPRGNDLSVGNNHNDIGGNTFQEFLRRVRLDGFRLVDMQIGCERPLLSPESR